MKIPFSYTTAIHTSGYLYVVAQGHADETQVENMYIDVRDTAIQNNCTNIMLNASSITLVYAMERFVPLMKRLVSQLTEFNIARICTLHDYKQDLIQNVATKGNVNLQNFTDELEAAAWLANQ